MNMWIQLPILRYKEQIEYIQSLLVKGTYIAGGAARYAASSLDVPPETNDFDIFGQDKEAVNNMKYALDEFIFVSENPMAYTYIIKHPDFGALKINLIREFVGYPEDVADEFDFTISRAFIEGNNVFVDENFQEDEKNKRLVIAHIHCPVSTMFRVIKYCQKGYKISLVEILKLFDSWQHLSDEHKETIMSLALLENPSMDEINTLERLLRIID